MAEEQNRDIKSYPTCELVEELKHREGVSTQWAGPESKMKQVLSQCWWLLINE